MTTTWIYLESHCLTCSLTHDCTENYSEGMKERRGSKCCKIMAQHRVCINLEDIYDPCTFLYVPNSCDFKNLVGFGAFKTIFKFTGVSNFVKIIKNLTKKKSAWTSNTNVEKYSRCDNIQESSRDHYFPSLGILGFLM